MASSAWYSVYTYIHTYIIFATSLQYTCVHGIGHNLPQLIGNITQQKFAKTEWVTIS